MNTSQGKALNRYVKLIGDGIFTDVDYFYNSFENVLTIMVDINQESFPKLDKIKNEKFFKRMMEGALTERFQDDIYLFFRSVIKVHIPRFEFEIMNL